MTQTTRRLFAFAAFAAAVTLTALLAGPAANAQTAAAPTGTITGRVFNTVTGQYLNNARVTIPGTNITAQTDDTGTYLLARVPLGEVTLEVFYTGMAPKRITLALDSPSATIPDIEFTAADRRAGTRDSAEDIIELEKYTVSDRTLDGAAIAINEQRFAPNLVTVVSTDEYGIVPDGNVGEFLKMLPGITMSYRQGDPREIGINGVDSGNVPVSLNGFDLASPELNGSTRQVELNAISVNTLSRVEVVFSPTPETRGDALAGSVNLVSRTAFERRRPEFNATTYMYWRTSTPQWYRTDGPRQNSTFKARPGFEFSWIMPVTKNFGFTVSAGASFQYKENSNISPTWRGAGSNTNPTNGFPDTTPGYPWLHGDVKPGDPYMNAINLSHQSSENTRTSFAISADWRPARNDVISFNFTYGTFQSKNTTRQMTFTINTVNPDFTMDRVSGSGYIDLQTQFNNRYTQTIMPTLSWRHKGPVWTTNLGIGYSSAQHLYRNLEKGFFNNAYSRRGRLNLIFDNIGYLRPGTITVTDSSTGATIDPYDINNYVLHGANYTATTSPNTGSALRSTKPTNNNDIITAIANAERTLPLNFPASVKLGLDYRSTRKDSTNDQHSWDFLGSDGAPSYGNGANAIPDGDNNSAPFRDTTYRANTNLYGFPNMPAVDNISLYNFYLTHPDYFRVSNNGIYDYDRRLSSSSLAKEAITAAYIRFDTQLLDMRLKLTGGIRFEQTEVNGWGLLDDASLNWRRDENGGIIYGPDKRPLLINPANTLDAYHLTYVERGSHTRVNYNTWFPSINASYIILSNLIARGAYYQTIGRPRFDQYSGGIRIGNSFSDQDERTTTLTVSNPNIKPWHASTCKFALEYYFQKVGVASISAFSRDYKNFFKGVEFPLTPEFADSVNLDYDTYADSRVVTNDNSSSLVRTYGIDLSYKANLTFLPRWARGVQLNANWSWLFMRDADPAIKFGNFVPRSGNLSLSLTRPKYTLRVNLSYKGSRKKTLQTTLNEDGTLQEINGNRSKERLTYSWDGERFFMDIRAEYSLTRKLGLFASVSGITLTNESKDQWIKGPNTPAVAILDQRGGDFGYSPLVTIGIKGKW